MKWSVPSTWHSSWHLESIQLMLPNIVVISITFNLSRHFPFIKEYSKNKMQGVPTVVRWVRNLTSVAWVAAETWVSIPSPAQWVKGSSIATAVA